MDSKVIHAINFLLFFFVFAVFTIVQETNLHTIVDDDILILTSWIGIFILFYLIFSYCKSGGALFSLYSIFIILSFLFFFGHFFLCAIGVQTTLLKERLIFDRIPVTTIGLLRSQFFFLSCIVAFHTAYIIFFKRSKKLVKKEVFQLNIDNYSDSIYKVSLLLSFLVIPITFYNLINDFITAQVYGYIGLYYGETAKESGSILTIGQMFFMCLIGLLIGSRYSKKNMIIVYGLFFLYMIIDLACGDRGGWFYPLLILAWMHHTFYKRFTKGFVIKASILGFFFLYIIQAVVSVRNFGITADSVQDALSFKDNPFFHFIEEMGGSMQIIIAAMTRDINYPYGNSVLLGLLAMVTMKIPAFLGIEYVPITDWFSWDYLGLNYGAGFSIFAETAINFGVYVTPIIFLLLGALSTKILNVSERYYSLTSLQLLFMIGSSYFLMTSIRNTYHDLFKYWFIGCFLFVFVIVFYYRITKKSRILKY